MKTWIGRKEWRETAGRLPRLMTAHYLSKVFRTNLFISRTRSDNGKEL